jgi:hypothetical protein
VVVGKGVVVAEVVVGKGGVVAEVVVGGGDSVVLVVVVAEVVGHFVVVDVVVAPHGPSVSP